MQPFLLHDFCVRSLANRAHDELVKIPFDQPFKRVRLKLSLKNRSCTIKGSSGRHLFRKILQHLNGVPVQYVTDLLEVVKDRSGPEHGADWSRNLESFTFENFRRQFPVSVIQHSLVIQSRNPSLLTIKQPCSIYVTCYTKMLCRTNLRQTVSRICSSLQLTAAI